MKAAAIALFGAALIGSVALAQPAPSGETLFKQRCSICHSVDPATPSTLGPLLAGVVGRKAASTAFPGYSAALKKSGLTWTPAKLDTFLAGPSKLVPGTRMSVILSDAAQRTGIVRYLATKK